MKLGGRDVTDLHRRRLAALVAQFGLSREACAALLRELAHELERKPVKKP